MISLKPNLQKTIWEELTRDDFISTPQEVFQTTKAALEAENDGLNIRPSHLNVIEVADFIGHLRDLWPHPGVKPVVLENKAGTGVVLKVPQWKDTVSVNTNALRIICNDHKEGRKASQTVDALAYLYAQEGQEFNVPEEWTIRRLRYYIQDRSLWCPADEEASWAKVNRPYTDGDWRTTRDEPLEVPEKAS